MIATARQHGARSVLLAVCAPPDYARRMHQVGGEPGGPFVGADLIFTRRLERLRAGRSVAR